MKIKVESCWSGGNNFSFRLTLPDGRRESVQGGTWNRQTAKEALDIFEHLYYIPRRSIRFNVH